MVSIEYLAIVTGKEAPWSSREHVYPHTEIYSKSAPGVGVMCITQHREDCRAGERNGQEVGSRINCSYPY